MDRVAFHWVIEVRDWGTLYARGSESQAEEWRAHKAAWEHAVATKRPATADEIRDHPFSELRDLLGGP